jgi:hypothetical protein
MLDLECVLACILIVVYILCMYTKFATGSVYKFTGIGAL